MTTLHRLRGSRVLRLVAAAYAVKTALLGLLWLFAPEIPERAILEAQKAWGRATSQTEAGVTR